MSSTRANKSPSDDGDTFDNTLFFHGASLSFADFAESDMMLLEDSFDNSTSHGIGLVHGSDGNASPAHPQKSTMMSRQPSSTTPSHTNTTVATLPPRNEEEKENQDSSDDSDTIRDEISYVRHKACILQRASHILLQPQRDYPALASFHACLQETKQRSDHHPSLVMNQMTIWDEARYFLQNENDAPEDITCQSPVTPPENEPFPDWTVTSSMKSLSAVQQYFVAHRYNPPLDSSVVPAVLPLGPGAADTHQPIRLVPPKYRIDTSTVQCVTSTQFDTARPRKIPSAATSSTTAATARISTKTENDDRRTVDDWYNSQAGAGISDQFQKKRQRCDSAVAIMGPPSTRATLLDRRQNHARDTIRRREPNTKLFRDRRRQRQPHVSASLRPYQRLLSSSFHPVSLPQRHDRAQEGDKWKLLHQATRTNRVN